MNEFVELWHTSVHPVNLPATVLLLLMVLYWLTVLLGVLDLTSLDVDMPDVDADLDLEIAHPHVDAFLEYFNVRHVPVTILLSFFALSFWFLGVVANHLIHGTSSLLLGSAVFAGNVVVSSHVAKFATLPLVPLFKGMRKHELSKKEIVGSRVVVTSSKVDDSFGQADLRDEEGPAITLNVRAENEVLRKGDEAVVLHHQPEKDIYIITKLEI